MIQFRQTPTVCKICDDIILDASSAQKIPVKSDRRHSRKHMHASVGMHLKEEQKLSGPFTFIRWQSRLLPKDGWWAELKTLPLQSS